MESISENAQEQPAANPAGSRLTTWISMPTLVGLELIKSTELIEEGQGYLDDVVIEGGNVPKLAETLAEKAKRRATRIVRRKAPVISNGHAQLDTGMGILLNSLEFKIPQPAESEPVKFIYRICGAICESWWFSIASSVLILVHCGALVDLANRPEGEAKEAQILSMVCLALFLLEMCFRTLGSPQVHWWHSGELVFDVLLAASACGEQVAAFIGKNPADGRYLFMCARVARSTHLFTLLRVPPNDVKLIWICIRAGIRAGFVALGALLYLLALTACMIQSLLQITSGDDDVVKSYYQNFGKSLNTQLVIMLGGLNWVSLIVNPLTSHRQGQDVFVGYLMFVVNFILTIVLVQMLIAVLMEQVEKADQNSRNEYRDEKIKNRAGYVAALRDVLGMQVGLDKQLGHSDEDDNQAHHVDDIVIPNIEQLEERIGRSLDALGTLDITREEVVHIFEKLNIDGSGVLLGDLLFTILKMSSPSETLDMLTIDFSQQAAIRKVAATQEDCSEGFKVVEDELDSVDRSFRKLRKSTEILGKLARELKEKLEDRLKGTSETYAKCKEDTTASVIYQELKLNSDRMLEKGEILRKLRSMKADAACAEENIQLCSFFGIHKAPKALPGESGVQALHVDEQQLSQAKELLRRAVRERLRYRLDPLLQAEFARKNKSRRAITASA